MHLQYINRKQCHIANSKDKIQPCLILSQNLSILMLNHRVSLTAPNCNYFEQVSLTALDIFWTQLPKLKN